MSLNASAPLSVPPFRVWLLVNDAETAPRFPVLLVRQNAVHGRPHIRCAKFSSHISWTNIEHLWPAACNQMWTYSTHRNFLVLVHRTSQSFGGSLKWSSHGVVKATSLSLAHSLSPRARARIGNENSRFPTRNRSLRCCSDSGLFLPSPKCDRQLRARVAVLISAATCHQGRGMDGSGSPIYWNLMNASNTHDQSE